MSSGDSTRPDPGREADGPSRRAVLRGGAACVGASALAGCVNSAPETGEHSPPALVAHRGCAAENPENTVAAVEAAAAVADAVEIDVRRCQGSELVAFHDETLDDVTDGSGRVDETPCADVLAREVEGSGETVPTIEAVFEAVPADVRVVLDLKTSGLAADVLSLQARHPHDVLLSSFERPVLEEVRALDESIPLAYIVRESLPNRALRPGIPGLPTWAYAPEDVADLVETTVELGCDAIHPRYELCLRTDLVARAHEADLLVEPWTIETRREFDALRAVGVDGVISDVCRGLAD